MPPSFKFDFWNPRSAILEQLETYISGGAPFRLPTCEDIRPWLDVLTLKQPQRILANYQAWERLVFGSETKLCILAVNDYYVQAFVARGDFVQLNYKHHYDSAKDKVLTVSTSDAMELKKLLPNLVEFLLEGKLRQIKPRFCDPEQPTLFKYDPAAAGKKTYMEQIEYFLLTAGAMDTQKDVNKRHVHVHVNLPPIDTILQTLKKKRDKFSNFLAAMNLNALLRLILCGHPPNGSNNYTIEHGDDCLTVTCDSPQADDSDHTVTITLETADGTTDIVSYTAVESVFCPRRVLDADNNRYLPHYFEALHDGEKLKYFEDRWCTFLPKTAPLWEKKIDPDVVFPPLVRFLFKHELKSMVYPMRVQTRTAFADMALGHGLISFQHVR